MGSMRDCGAPDESVDPCPKCGATVKGDDPVNGVCQAGSWAAAEIERLRAENTQLRADIDGLTKR